MLIWKLLCGAKIWRKILFFSLLFTVSFELRAWSASRDSINKIESYLRENRINCIVLYGKGDKPMIIDNNLYLNGPYQITQSKYFPIASLQKVFTGIAVYKLEREGYIYWDEPVEKILPELHLPRKVTIKRLMTHTSGLRDNYSEVDKPLYTEKGRIQYGLKNYKISTTNNWNYASSNYVVLSYLINKISRESYYKYIYGLFNDSKLNMKPFNSLNYKEVVLQPKLVSESGKKETLISWMGNSILTSNPDLFEKLSWFNFSKDVSKTYGAGDMLATPQSYWRFVTTYLLKDKAMIDTWNNLTVNDFHPYFGGVYIKDPFIYASGNVNDTCCFFIANYHTGNTIMLFSNNTNYLKLKNLKYELKRLYFYD